MKEIPLTQGKVAQVSDHRFDYINQWKWYANEYKGGPWYACRNDKKRPSKKTILMHRVITNAPDGTETDHFDGNGLNNQDDNLRVCSHAQNMKNKKKRLDNTSGYIGVVWNKANKKWIAQIGYNDTHVSKTCESITEAARIYDKLAKELFGEFARTNF